MDRSGGRNFRIAGRRIVALEGAAPKRAGPTIRKLPAGGGCQDWRKIRKIPNLCSRGFAAAVTAIRSRSGVHLSWRPPPQSFEPHAPAMTAPGTKLPRTSASACPQLAKADMRALHRCSGFDPKRSSSRQRQWRIGCKSRFVTHLISAKRVSSLAPSSSIGDRLRFDQLQSARVPHAGRRRGDRAERQQLYSA
jgi:hypothetical protein